jgi:hypothetical protein
MRQVDMHFADLQFQFHTIHRPGRRDSQNLLVQLSVLHGGVSGGDKESSPPYPLACVLSARYDHACPAKRNGALLQSNSARDSRNDGAAVVFAHQSVIRYAAPYIFRNESDAAAI